MYDLAKVSFNVGGGRLVICSVALLQVFKQALLRVRLPLPLSSCVVSGSEKNKTSRQNIMYGVSNNEHGWSSSDPLR